MQDRDNFDHYVAQHYIKLFAKPDGKAYVGDIETKSVVETDDFTRLLGKPNWSVAQEIEDGFTRAESAIANALRTVKDNHQAIRGLAVNTKRGLKDFICVHAARSVGLHDTINQSGSQMQSELERIAPPFVDKSKLQIPETSRPESLALGIDLADAIETTLRLKGCVAIEAPSGKQFILGDNPLVRLSTQKEFYMRGGLPNRTTYLWFPLSPSLGLFFGHEIGNIIDQGPIKLLKASSKLCNALNRAEVYLATKHIVAQSKGLLKGKIRLENVGDQRAKVTALDWAPFIFTENKELLQIPEELIEGIRNQL